MKKCSWCREDKDESEYGKDSRTISGLRCYCNKCRAVSPEWYEKRKIIHKNRKLLKLGLRICFTCKIEKDIGKFYTNTKGVHSDCKECTITKNAGGIENRKAYLESELEYVELLSKGQCRCTGCNEVKELSGFYMRNGKPRRPCKECELKQRKRFYKDNRISQLKRSRAKYARDPAKHCAIVTAYTKTPKGRAVRRNIDQKRRAIELNAVHEDNTDIIKRRLEVGVCKCFYCGLFFEACDIEDDHIEAISKSLDDTRANRRPACRSCNAKKNNKTMSECVATHVDFHS